MQCLQEEDKQFWFITVFFPIWHKWAQDQTVSQQKPSMSILIQQVIFKHFQYPSCMLTSGLIPINVLQLKLARTPHFLTSLTLLLCYCCIQLCLWPAFGAMKAVCFLSLSVTV